MVFFGGARRHKIIRQNDEEFVFRCQYSGTDPFTTGGRESPAYPLLHWHRRQDEWIKVLSGRIGYVLNGKEFLGSAGDVVTIPRGATHTFWCDPSSGEDAVMEFTARPGSGIDAEWLNTVYGVMDSLYRQGKTLGFLQTMVWALDSESGPGVLPKWLGMLLVAIFGRIGLMAGYKVTHPVYANVVVETEADSVDATVVNDETPRDSRRRKVAGVPA